MCTTVLDWFLPLIWQNPRDVISPQHKQLAWSHGTDYSTEGKDTLFAVKYLRCGFKMLGPDHFASPPKALQAKRQLPLQFRWSQSPPRLEWKDMDYILAEPPAPHVLRRLLPPQLDLFHLLSIIVTVTQSRNCWVFYQCLGFFSFDTAARLRCGYPGTRQLSRAVCAPTHLLHRGLMPGRSRILCPGSQGW